MQVLSVGLARSIWLFDVNELNPSGKSIFPDVLAWLADKYAFQTFPKGIHDIDQEKKGWLFKTGTFQPAGEDAITVNLSVFNDGFVAETWSSTEHGDLFLEDVLKSVSRKYGLAFTPEMISTKTYINELIIRLEHPLSNLNPRVKAFANILTEVFRKHNLPPFEFTGMSFAPDTSSSAYKPPGLVIERKVNTPFPDNRYWSKSPFSTTEHVRLLREFEKMLVP